MRARVFAFVSDPKSFLYLLFGGWAGNSENLSKWYDLVLSRSNWSKHSNCATKPLLGDPYCSKS